MITRLALTLILLLVGSGVLTIVAARHRRRATAVTAVTTVNSSPRLLYFHGDHCAGCTTQSRFLDHLADGVPIQRIDVGREPAVAERYGIFTLPTTLVVDGAGTVRHINYGVTDNVRLKRQLEKIL